MGLVADHSHLILSLKMSGDVSPLLHKQKDHIVKMMDPKVTDWCRIFKRSVHGYSAGQNITAVW